MSRLGSLFTLHFFGIIISTGISTSAIAYDNEITHKMLSKNAIIYSSLWESNLLRDILADEADMGFFSLVNSKSVGVWIEDDKKFCRMARRFYSEI